MLVRLNLPLFCHYTTTTTTTTTTTNTTTTNTTTTTKNTNKPQHHLTKQNTTVAVKDTDSAYAAMPPLGQHKILATIPIASTTATHVTHKFHFLRGNAEI
jgi:hypothetical protein